LNLFLFRFRGVGGGEGRGGGGGGRFDSAWLTTMKYMFLSPQIVSFRTLLYFMYPAAPHSTVASALRLIAALLEVFPDKFPRQCGWRMLSSSLPAHDASLFRVGRPASLSPAADMLLVLFCMMFGVDTDLGCSNSPSTDPLVIPLEFEGFTSRFSAFLSSPFRFPDALRIIITILQVTCVSGLRSSSNYCHLSPSPPPCSGVTLLARYLRSKMLRLPRASDKLSWRLGRGLVCAFHRCRRQAGALSAICRLRSPVQPRRLKPTAPDLILDRPARGSLKA
jgi:hypothetical protein